MESALTRFHASLAQGDCDGLEAVLHPVWTVKRVAGEGVACATRAELLADPGSHRGARAHLSAIQMCFDDFAIARVDDWEPAATSLFLLFRERGAWCIAGEAVASAAVGSRDARFSARAEEGAVLTLLEHYYRAVTDGDPATIDRIFASDWEMKNHEEHVAAAEARILSEDRQAFIERIVPGPLPGYWDDRQISDVQIVAGRLAYVRVDKPSTPSTTVFLFMKNGGVWEIIDKAWIDGRVEARR